jgi:hypothetical protein
MVAVGGDEERGCPQSFLFESRFEVGSGEQILFV